MLELAKFQLKAISELNEKMLENKHEIVLKSPTGSGKTIILTHFIDQYIKGNPNKVFIWLTPGKGELEKQSKAKMDKYIHNSSTKLLSDVMNSGFEEDDVCFINWEKLTKRGNNALKEGEKVNFKEHVKKALNKSLEFVVVIDESHQNNTLKANEVLSLFNADKVIRTSATPTYGKDVALIEISESEVIEEGLIKKVLVINEGFSSNTLITDPSEFLIDKALEKQFELNTNFKRLNSSVNPLIIIQFPNDSDEAIGAVEKYLATKNITYDNGLLAIWLSDKKENLEDVEMNNAKPIIILIKQAIATGWDCPRAHILVKLRENSNEVFEIQTIGRIRRMPEAKHYGKDKLDSCYLYTFDEKFTEGVKAELGKNALNGKILTLKPKFKDFGLINEQRSGLSSSNDATIAINSIMGFYKDTYHLDDDLEGNKSKLEEGGYVFSNVIRQKTFSGSVQNLSEDDFKKLDSINLTEELDVNRHSRDYHNRLSRIGLRISLTYEKMSTIVRRLFNKSSKNKKLLALTVKDLYAFIINNYNKLIEDFVGAISMAGKGKQTQLNLFFDQKFSFPESFVFTYDGSNKIQEVYSKNIYKDYLSSAEKRSDSEKSFERFCEDTESVDWFYKNGDKGSEYFSIGYYDNAGTAKLFYPDYIVSVQNTIWIVETKGGFSNSGKSEDIDAFSRMKFDYLIKYANKHALQAAFVRKDKSNNELFICTADYSDDIKSDSWVQLSKVFS
ncbi:MULTISPECIES: DEAD/DEAH box helicase [Bacillus cereus group]|uniref:Type III restriction enzyme, res subunit family n=1 Tax=Bacillus cereus (strain AH187) TaxID=405534 RepID=B7HW67_BACC7|nr:MULTISPECIES: DEAD/DEAH box helicase family protein [Bacillus cereus group]ACJ77361.1 type III restriction enzyme, res subunit family [Bacillus cereus AH187]EEK97933.1 DNA or RNA helicase of superfamily II-like protein [Bacillus cereus BDRD-ST26]KFK76087.1 DEAD/DEAH box helicase family protein [Bacillus cereus]BAL20844.1 conserved hypothetical protein [Bacillus cereus NC7401]KXI88418.1 restriction endonuclease subunit R [Bacillus cereus]